MPAGDIVLCTACAEEVVETNRTHLNGTITPIYLHTHGWCLVTGKEQAEPFVPIREQVVSELLDLDEMDRMLA